MARALYYIAAVTALAFGAESALGVALYVTYRPEFRLYDLYLLVQPLLLSGAGVLLLRKHRREAPGDIPFDKTGVVSVAGLGCLVGGCVWLASEVRFAFEIAHANNEIEMEVVRRVLAPLVLLVAGAFFAFVYPGRAAAAAARERSRSAP